MQALRSGRAVSKQPSMLQLIATELRAALRSLPVMLLILGMLSYRIVHDDGQPWWLPIALFVAAVGIGWFLGWRKARKPRKR